MELVDIHSHNIKKQAGVVSVVNLPFTEVSTHPELDFISRGIHPWETECITDDDYTLLKNLIKEQNVKLIGECGLDKIRGASLEKQFKVFEKQIELSEEIGKPLIIHCVGYFNELFSLRKKINPIQKWIIHGFRGKPQLAEQALKSGFDISFGEKFNIDAVKIVPAEHLFVETDESVLSVKQVYTSIAKIKQMEIEKIDAGNVLLKLDNLTFR